MFLYKALLLSQRHPRALDGAKGLKSAHWLWVLAATTLAPPLLSLPPFLLLFALLPSYS